MKVYAYILSVVTEDTLVSIPCWALSGSDARPRLEAERPESAITGNL